MKKMLAILIVLGAALCAQSQPVKQPTSIIITAAMQRDHPVGDYFTGAFWDWYFDTYPNGDMSLSLADELWNIEGRP